MKTLMMKLCLAALLLSSPLAFAQTVEKDLGTNGDWKGALINDHTLWKKNACLAFTKSSDGGSLLELYAEQAGETKGSFVEPTLQVVTKEVGFVRGVLSDNNEAESYQLILAPNKDAKPVLGLITRLGDRKKAVDLLKRASGAKLVLFNAKGKALKTLTFSLKGSTKGIDSVIAACKLAL